MTDFKVDVIYQYSTYTVQVAANGTLAGILNYRGEPVDFLFTRGQKERLLAKARRKLVSPRVPAASK